MFMLEYLHEPDAEPDPLSSEPHREPYTNHISFGEAITEYNHLITIMSLLKYNMRHQFECSHNLQIAKTKLSILFVSRTSSLSIQNIVDYDRFDRNIKQAKIAKLYLKNYVKICNELEQDAVFIMNLLGYLHINNIKLDLEKICYDYYKYLKGNQNKRMYHVL